MTVEDGWVAGILEGEGCIRLERDGTRRRVRVRVNMCDEDVIARLAAIWGVSYQPRKVKAGNRPQFTTQIRDARAVEVLTRLSPLFGARRRARIDECLAALGPSV